MLIFIVSNKIYSIFKIRLNYLFLGMKNLYSKYKIITFSIYINYTIKKL